MGLGIGSGRGGRRTGAGRPKGVKTRWPTEIAAELRRLADGLQRLREYRRNEREALEPILRRLVAIERALGLREKIEAPRVSRRRPLGA
jgi:hypothetical protein